MRTCPAIVVSLVSAISGRASAGEPSESRVHGWIRSTMSLGARPYFSREKGTLVEYRTAPVVSEFALDGESGLPGITVAVSGWLTLDLADRTLSERALADFGEAFVQWRSDNLSLFGGRMLLMSLSGRGLRVDGARVLVHPMKRIFGGSLWTDVWAGLPVEPTFGEEPLRGRLPLFPADPLDVAKGATDWRRPGDWALGGSFGYSWSDVVRAEFGFLHVQDLAEIRDRAAVMSLSLQPSPVSGFRVFGAADLYARAIEEAEIEAHHWASDDVRATLFLRFVDPALLLPSMSILSVFGGPKHADAGAGIDAFIHDTWRLSGTFEIRRATVLSNAADADDERLGHRILVSVRAPLPASANGRARLAYERTDDPWYGGYHHAHAGIEQPVSERMTLGFDGAAFFFRRADGPDDASRIALRAGVSGRARWGDFGASVAARVTQIEDLSTDFTAMGRLEWNVFDTF